MTDSSIDQGAPDQGRPADDRQAEGQADGRPTKIRVVLARPQTGENVGFVVRLCANHALTDLVLVDPRSDWLERATCTASMCRDLLAKVRVVEEMHAAVSDCDLIFGLTCRQGRERPTYAIEDVQETARPGESLALVFGNEESGLSGDESAHCTHLFQIARAGLQSLNLSHAVSVVLHELTRGDAHVTASGKTPSLTTRDERVRIRRRIESTLGDWRFELEDSHVSAALDRLVEGQALQKRDARIVDKVLRHFEWLRESAGDAG